MAHRVVERQNVSMETQPSDGVVAVAVFYVAAHRMPHVGSMDTYLLTLAQKIFTFLTT